MDVKKAVGQIDLVIMQLQTLQRDSDLKAIWPDTATATAKVLTTD